MFEQLMKLGLPPAQTQVGQAQTDKKTARQILQENGHSEQSLEGELTRYGFMPDQIKVIKTIVLDGIPPQKAIADSGMNIFRAQQTWGMVTQLAAKLGYKL